MPDFAVTEKPVRVLALFGGVALLGSERGNLEPLSALKGKGAEVLLLVSDAPWAEDMRNYVLERGFEIRLCPYLLLPRPERRFNPWITYPKVITRASIVLLKEVAKFRPTHIHISNELFALNFLLALLVSSAPVIYRCGDKPVLHNRLFRSIWRFIVRRANKFVAVSCFIAKQLEDAGVLRDRITVVYSRPPARQKGRDSEPLNIETHTFNIVFLGQINESKGVHVLIEAFRIVAEEFPQARLLIAGRISEWEGDAWARALRDNTLRDERIGSLVRFPGFVEDVPGLMGQCHVNVIPTLTEEPLANVIFEAKQAGLASIIFPSGGLPETIDDGVDGYICPDKNVEALANALRYYLSDPSKAERQGGAAKASLKKFAIAEFANQWAKVYESPRGPGQEAPA